MITGGGGVTLISEIMAEVEGYDCFKNKFGVSAIIPPGNFYLAVRKAVISWKF